MASKRAYSQKLNEAFTFKKNVIHNLLLLRTHFFNEMTNKMSHS